ncbi:MULTISPECIES: hypothetical protein [unclassified Mesorhizobium]|uniref:hypothetical protein n=1 Tax=unclassified Mesorhizobium TaxID=325217 RepID=UPI001FDF4129|nr:MULTISPECIES: hypothetical protein [unclassified Mesorhizobium]
MMMNGLVLVVEDEPMILLDIEGGLVEAGFDVVGVNSAGQALSAFDAAWIVQRFDIRYPPR